MSLENAILELAKAMNRIADGLEDKRTFNTFHKDLSTELKDIQEKSFKIDVNCLPEIAKTVENNFDKQNSKKTRTKPVKDQDIISITIPNPPEAIIQEESDYILEDCLNALRAYLAKHKDYASSQALLKNFNVEILGDLPETKFKEFIELANKGKFGAK